MKTLCLLPYCPYPVTTGARAVFEKHLKMLSSIGECCVISTRRRPVGFGWQDVYVDKLAATGFDIKFNESSPINLLKQAYGMAYAVLFKGFGKTKAFGHSNPYHRYAFDPDWVYEQSKHVDLAEIHYSYWSYLSTACPKVLIVHDIWSNIMWEGDGKETEDLKKADLLVTVSYDDFMCLQAKGFQNIVWSPPVTEEKNLPDSNSVAIIGSGNAHNREGLQWLSLNSGWSGEVTINCYGAISDYATGARQFVSHGYYDNKYTPYANNGIILMATKEGTGVQIKGIEALACGRAIVARRGAMRGLPREDGAWIEVDTSAAMLDAVRELMNNKSGRDKLMKGARAYYNEYLDSNLVTEELKSIYKSMKRP